MTAAEYEAYVEQVVRELDFWASATISRNKRFRGVRQPGSYEIDIAFELFLTDLIAFRLIVECKNYKRPVTRPVVQQLAQTRDAINADKAAIASPSGFSKEAIDVARDLGIALWVIARDVPFDVVMANEGLKIMGLSDLYFSLRTDYLALFGIADVGDDLHANLVAPLKAKRLSAPHRESDGLSDATELSSADARVGCQFYRSVTEGSARFTYEHHPLIDDACAQAQIVEWAFTRATKDLLADRALRRLVDRWEQGAKARFKNARVAQHAIQCVKANDHRAFFKLLW